MRILHSQLTYQKIALFFFALPRNIIKKMLKILIKFTDAKNCIAH